jgi:hypothetical protein
MRVIFKAVEVILICGQYLILNHFAEGGQDRMRNVCVQFGASLFDLFGEAARNRIAALVAVHASDDILVMTSRAPNRQFAARHGDEEALVSLDESDVSHHETVIEGDATKRS